MGWPSLYGWLLAVVVVTYMVVAVDAERIAMVEADTNLVAPAQAPSKVAAL